MKFLLVLLVVLFGVWVWRSNRSNREPPTTPKTRPAPDATKAIEMVACDVCGVHSPRTDAVVGLRGLYCSAKHRNQVES